MIYAIINWVLQFDIRLVGLALMVCSAGSYVVSVLLARSLATAPARRWLWLLLLEPIFGADVWATHFIAMLAFLPGPQLFYEVNRTLLSIVAAMAGAVLPLSLVLYRPRWRATPPLGGAGLALAIGAMHFTGMSAMHFCGAVSYNSRFGVAAFVIGGAAAAVMLRLLLVPNSVPRVAPATLALILAICGMHFTAMMGDSIVIDGRGLPGGKTGLFGGDTHLFAIWVAATSGLLLLGAFSAVLVDRKIALMSQYQAEALGYYASHDELTQLANRRQLNDELTKLLAVPDHNFLILYLDLDRFKSINILFGHATGDRLLRLVADRLRDMAGSNAVAGRLGGDEFLLIQPLPPGAAPDTGMAERALRAMAEPFIMLEGTLRIGASIGIEHCRAGFGCPVPEQLLVHADVALAQAKLQGGGRFCLYHPDMDAQLAARRQLERDLGEALSRGEMFLHFQPLCSATGRAHGFEALLRWKHRERGIISPTEFIPFAERSGHIRAIGLFVLEEACRTAMGWPEELRVAVNISAVQLGDDTLFDNVKEILERTGLPPHRLELEITESTLIEDAVHVGALLRRMHDFGLELAIDDFGTGYSNLSHLRDFCAGTLKLDRSFISGLRGNTDAASIIGAITGLGHALGMKVLAEGVETETELRLIRAMGCDEVQGYYLARPMPAAEITGWLAKSANSPVGVSPAGVSTATMSTAAVSEFTG